MSGLCLVSLSSRFKKLSSVDGGGAAHAGWCEATGAVAATRAEAASRQVAFPGETCGHELLGRPVWAWPGRVKMPWP